MFGKVEFFNNPKGWGVIKNDVGESFFVHHKDIVDEKFFPDDGPPKYRTLKPGQDVQFVIKETDRPLNQAVDVRLTETVVLNDAT